MNKLRIGLVGYGTMGKNHAKYLSTGEVPDAEITAVCDISPDSINRAKTDLGGKVNAEFFDDPQKLMKSGLVDGILIVVPHYGHPTLILEALKHNLHVLTEKPVGVYTKNIRQVNAAAAKSKKVFGIMFNQRTNPVFQKLRQMITSGELGEIKRTNWIVTNWYRSQSYYDAGGWRATWGGEGGGV
jgi:predicted dehydrogenase